MSDLKTEIKPKAKLLVETLTDLDKLKIMEEKRLKKEKAEQKKKEENPK